MYPTKRPLTPRDLTAKNAIVIQQSVSDSTLVTQDIADDYQIICECLNVIIKTLSVKAMMCMMMCTIYDVYNILLQIVNYELLNVD